MRRNVLSPLKRDGESGGRRGRKRRGVQPRVDLQLREDDLNVRPHGLLRDPELGSHLLAGAPCDEKLEHPLLLLG